MKTEIYQNELFDNYETYFEKPSRPIQFRQAKSIEISNRQSVRNSKVDLSKISNSAVSLQKDGWTIKKMFDPSYLSPGITWDYDPNERFKAVIADFQITRVQLEDDYDYYYLNIVYMVNIPDIGVRLVKQEDLPANLTSGSNLTKYLFVLGFNLYEMQEFNPQDLIGIDVWVGIGRNESDFFTVNYVEKFGN